jgi:SAM-dependent methyltransferase
MPSSRSSDDTSLFGVAHSWMRESLAYRGGLRTFAYLGEQFWTLLKDSRPEQRRMRFGDIEYDCDYGVDTTWARLPLRVRLREIFSERQYQPTVPQEFHEIMERLPADIDEYTFVDLGSGKGRALLLAAEYPFRRIIGVELQAELHRIAEQNIATFDSPTQLCRDITSVAADARHYEFPDEPFVLYLFNPFPEYVMKTVTENLQQSLERRHRPVYVIYNTPECGFILNSAPALHRIVTTERYSIYVSK